jgi:hypothetical protein
MSTVPPAPAAGTPASKLQFMLLNRKRIRKFKLGDKGTRALLSGLSRDHLLCLRIRPAQDQDYQCRFFGTDHVAALNRFLRDTPKELRGIAAWIIQAELKGELDAIA